MMKVNSVLQVEEMDYKKIEKMREVRAARARAIHDPIVRSRAIDPVECANQVNEKQTRIKAEKEAERLAVLENQRISKLIATRDLQDKMKRKKEVESVRRSWDLQSDRSQRTTAYLDGKVADMDPINTEECGLGSLQKFSGEDRSRFERKRLQARQMDRFVKEQLHEKKVREELEKADARNYINEIDQVDQFLATQEAKAEEEKRKEMRKLAGENRLTASMNNDYRLNKSKAEAEQNRQEMENNLTSNFLNETGGQGRTNFKGFAPEVRAKFESENSELVVQKRTWLQKEKNDDLLRANNDQKLNRQILRAEVEVQQDARKQRLYLQQSQLQQMVEQNDNKKKANDAAKGAVGKEFFGNFGTSFR